jgi:uncharacterized membrane protein
VTSVAHTTNRLPLLARTALLGLATGGRSSSGLAGVSWTATPADAAPLGVLAGPRLRAGATAFALGEGIVDKLPQTPSRLSAGPLAGRVVLGALCGVALAARPGAVPVRALPVAAWVPGAVVGGSAAVAGAYLGAAWRRGAPFGSDLPAALVEDAVVVLLSLAACRR